MFFFKSDSFPPLHLFALRLDCLSLSPLVPTVAELEKYVAQERAPCLGLCKLAYISLWLVTYPICKVLKPTGR